MKIACEGFRVETTPSGNHRTVKTYSYVVTLTEIDGSRVKAVRMDGYTSKERLYGVVEEQYPGWKIKNTLKLYDDDFVEGYR